MTISDKKAIAGVTRYASDVATYFNRSLVPLCRDCGVTMDESNYRDFMEDFNNVGDIYVESALREINNRFLADSVRESVEKSFKEIMAAHEVRLPSRHTVYKDGLQAETFEARDMFGYLTLHKGWFVVNREAIEATYTRRVKASSEAIRKVQALCDAINTICGGDFSLFPLLPHMIHWDENNKAEPSRNFNYKLIEK